MTKKLNIAIVGAGTWGENHAEIYYAHPFVNVIAIADMNLERARLVAKRVRIPQVYSDYRKMIEESGCDAVAIVTPDFAHADIAVAAANCKKHILVEKPLATTEEDVHRIVRAVRENGVRAMVDLHNRWSPPFNAAHRLLEQGELGTLQSAYFRLNDVMWVATDMLPWAAKSSILWFLGSHSLDTLRWFFKDEVARVFSVSRTGVLSTKGVETEDLYQTTLEFRGGGVAQMENGWITPNANPCVNDIKFNALGSKGMISIDASNHNMVQFYSAEKTIVPDCLVQNSIFGKPKGFAFESIRAFVDCLLDGTEFPVSLEDAANVSLTILTIMKSAATRMPVEVQGLYECRESTPYSLL